MSVEHLHIGERSLFEVALAYQIDEIGIGLHVCLYFLGSFVSE